MLLIMILGSLGLMLVLLGLFVMKGNLNIVAGYEEERPEIRKV